jgi:hypothetical protein
MSITNATGWAIIDWSKPNARVTFVQVQVVQKAKDMAEACGSRSHPRH